MYQLRGTTRQGDDFWGPRLFDQYNMWISYEVAEDLPYLMNYVGEDHFVVGTDYGHHSPGTTDRLSADPSAQVHLVTQMRTREDISSATAEKILTDNPAALYGV